MVKSWKVLNLQVSFSLFVILHCSLLTFVFPGFAGSEFVAGDVRATEHNALLILQVLFLREHNRLARLIEQTGQVCSSVFFFIIVASLLCFSVSCWNGFI
jgi:hypothetical protein